MSFSTSGEGCPAESAYYDLNCELRSPQYSTLRMANSAIVCTIADNGAVTVVFSNFNADIGPGIPISATAKQCTIVFGFSIPDGYSLGIASVDYHSSYALDGKISVIHRSTYYCQLLFLVHYASLNMGLFSMYLDEGDYLLAIAESVLDGPLAVDLYIHRDHFSPATVVSTCGQGSTEINIDTQIVLTNSSVDAGRDAGSSGYLATVSDSATRVFRMCSNVVSTRPGIHF